jgi:putative ABC transport system ATP-binding protein
MVAVVEVRELSRSYRRGDAVVTVLQSVDMTVEAGELVVVMGPSGAGKSTLLHLMGGLDTPTAGRVVIVGSDLGALDDEALTAFRRHSLGFVFQFFNLLPTLSAWENVAVPRLLDGRRLRSLRPGAVALLERVGLGHRVDHRPAELSGGELQRVAIARALMGDPVLVLADEPTGNLDSASGDEVLDLLAACARVDGRTVVMATHDTEAAARGDRTVHLRDGRVVPPPSSRV